MSCYDITSKASGTSYHICPMQQQLPLTCNPEYSLFENQNGQLACAAVGNVPQGVTPLKTFSDTPNNAAACYSQTYSSSINNTALQVGSIDSYCSLNNDGGTGLLPDTDARNQ